jgi:hypothetical protein
MDFLLTLLATGTDAERSAALIAVGEVSVAIKKETKPYLEAIIKEIQTTLTSKERKSSVNEVRLLIEQHWGSENGARWSENTHVSVFISIIGASRHRFVG